MTEHSTVQDLTPREVTVGLVQFLSGDPVVAGLRIAAVSDVNDGEAVEIVLEDSSGHTRRYRLQQVIESISNWPQHYRDDGTWCPWSGGDRRATDECPTGCAGSLETRPSKGSSRVAAPARQAGGQDLGSGAGCATR